MSRPAADLSIESLALLTSTQALADLARFVSYVKAYDPSEPDDASTTVQRRWHCGPRRTPRPVADLGKRGVGEKRGVGVVYC